MKSYNLLSETAIAVTSLTAGSRLNISGSDANNLLAPHLPRNKMLTDISKRSYRYYGCKNILCH